jgi:hypothetical protein
LPEATERSMWRTESRRVEGCVPGPRRWLRVLLSALLVLAVLAQAGSAATLGMQSRSAEVAAPTGHDHPCDRDNGAAHHCHAVGAACSLCAPVGATATVYGPAGVSPLAASDRVVVGGLVDQLFRPPKLPLQV